MWTGLRGVGDGLAASGRSRITIESNPFAIIGTATRVSLNFSLKAEIDAAGTAGAVSDTRCKSSRSCFNITSADVLWLTGMLN